MYPHICLLQVDLFSVLNSKLGVDHRFLFIQLSMISPKAASALGLHCRKEVSINTPKKDINNPKKGVNKQVSIFEDQVASSYL